LKTHDVISVPLSFDCHDVHVLSNSILIMIKSLQLLKQFKYDSIDDALKAINSFEIRSKTKYGCNDGHLRRMQRFLYCVL